MDIYFILWVKSSTIAINFFAQIVPALAIGTSFKMAPVFLKMYLFGRVVGGGELPVSLALQDVLCSFGIFLVPPMESTIFPRNSYSFYGRMVYRNQDVGTGCSHCCCGVIAPRLSQ